MPKVWQPGAIFLYIFFRYECGQQRKTCTQQAAGYAKFSPLKSIDVGVFTYEARLATPNAN